MSTEQLQTMKQQALKLLRENRLVEAGTLLSQICAQNGEDVDAWYLLSSVHGMLGNMDEADRCCRRVIALNPDHSQAHLNLGNVLLSQGNLDEAVVHYQTALRINPGYAEAHCNLGNILESMGRDHEAQASYRQALSINPDFAIAYFNLGNLLVRQQRLSEAQESYRQALRINPGYADAHTNLGYILSHLGWLDEALGCHQRALQLKPNNADCLCNIGIVLELQGKLDAAMESFDQALHLDPNHLKAIVGKASVLARQRKFEAAYELLRPCLDSGIADASAAITLASFCHHINRCAEVIALIERLLGQRNQSIGQHDLATLHFALGNLYDAIGSFDDAFNHYHQANELKSRGYDPLKHVRFVDSLITIYNKDFLNNAPHGKNESQRPVFIIGMPRSGTSLVEQILASHPRIHGAGELEVIGRMTDALPAELGVNTPYPQCLSSLTQEKCDELAQRYLEQLASQAGDALRVTDKMPRNFLHLGFITLLFPHARIIHCIRNPLDTCLSCYFQRFVGGNEFADNLADLGAYYNQYLRLMRHWKTTLDISMLEIRYEELVADQETMSRTLIEYCGLEWDDHCLRFFENKRTVATASYDQVSQPMYTKSVERWRNYEKYLGPLKKALAEEIPDRMDIPLKPLK